LKPSAGEHGRKLVGGNQFCREGSGTMKAFQGKLGAEGIFSPGGSEGGVTFKGGGVFVPQACGVTKGSKKEVQRSSAYIWGLGLVAQRRTKGKIMQTSLVREEGNSMSTKS